MEWVYDDGGRSRYFKGEAGDCVVRAIAIAGKLDYKEVYDELAAMEKLVGGKKSARNGVSRKTIRKWFDGHGWRWTPTMGIGTGCKVHMRADELPGGRIVCNLSGHLAAVVDGTLRDTHDCTRGGTRCVYGYWEPPVGPMRHEGHGDTRLFREQIEALTDDFTAGLLAWCEYGQQAERLAKEYAGWSE